jgi:uncharacterized damage-inducible protein DinB
VEVGDDGGCMAHVAELPGCCVVGPDEAMVLAVLPAVIARHRAWRAAHSLPRLGDDDAPLALRQTVIGPRPWAINGASALFSVDRRLLTDQEFEAHLRVLACARADLLRAAHAIPRGAFDEATPGQARTVRDILAHIADTEEWLISRLGRRVQVTEPDPLRRIVDVRARTLEHLTRYDRVDRDLIFIPTERLSEDPEEMWSLRKFLRRLIEHELQHLDDLQASAEHWSGGTGLE